MDEAKREQYLKHALRILAAVFVLGFYPLTIVWPSGWVWHAGQSNYLQMMIGIYATLGVFLFLAASNPDQHLSLISFTIWSSIVHGGTMAVQSMVNPEHWAHMYGDVLALFLAAALLGWLSPRAFTLPFARNAA
jgi:hypothetical protein